MSATEPIAGQAASLTLRLAGSAKRITVRIDLDGLTPIGRALAEVLSTALDREGAGDVRLRSALTRREILSTLPPELAALRREQADVFGIDLDAQDEVTDYGWSPYDPGRDGSPEGWLEEQAARLPVGYYPVAGGWLDRYQTSQETADAADAQARTQLTRDQCAQLARISPGTWSGYVTRGQAPQPVRRVGRSGLWDAEEVRAWIEQRPGPGRWGPRP